MCAKSHDKTAENHWRSHGKTMPVSDPKHTDNTTMTTTQIGTETTEREVKQIAKEAVEYKISELIQPSDVKDGANKWEDIDRYDVEKECHESAEIMLKEQQGPFYGMVRDYAIILWRDGMDRINLDSDLVSDGITERECLTVYGKWPYSMSYFEVYQVLDEWIEETNIHQIPNACYNEAKETVETGIVYGMMPDCFGMEIN